ncbi:phosphate ABC transporter substrate-binding protein PstS [Pseudonocardia petroleophila]|uniref:Phosphate-binding protein n=1 Tax=Pseudonocardia petroleophila TaxID=37331 RepID=A0A7G7ML64_9PSEU|nr:phosphate ABC transporter substrate-binding protein PstS [Pseudonocardia petroleophila]
MCSCPVYLIGGVRPLSLPSVRGERPPRAATTLPGPTTEELHVKIVRHSARARVAAVGLATSGALLLAGCGAANESGAPAAGGEAAASASASIAGAGATSQQAAMEAWVAGFSSVAPDATVSYDAQGSGAGRTQFVDGAVQFAGSDSALNDEQLPLAQTLCGGADNVIELPLYVSPIAVIFNLPGVTELQLSPATIAKLFNGSITNWNDPAIAAENAGVTLPDLAVTPVNRADDSGTTENFTEYLAATAPADWTSEPDGVWPLSGGASAQGTSGVVGLVGSGAGSIGYADESQAGDLGKVSVQVGSEYVAPTAEAAAAVVAASPRVEGKGAANFSVELARDTTESGTYPVVLVSYTLACTQYADAAVADTVKAFLTYIASDEGQQAANANAGNAPITAEQRAQFQPVIDSISAAG